MRASTSKPVDELPMMRSTRQGSDVEEARILLALEDRPSCGERMRFCGRPVVVSWTTRAYEASHLYSGIARLSPRQHGVTLPPREHDADRESPGTAPAGRFAAREARDGGLASAGS